MGVYAGPDVSESGLVLALDGANYKSFKGEPTTNLITDPLALSGLPSPFTYDVYEATAERTGQLPNSEMKKISPYWIKLVKTSPSNGRAIVYAQSGYTTGVDYCRSFYVYSEDTNLTQVKWLSENSNVETTQSYTQYTPSDLGQIKRIQTIFRSVSGSTLDALRFGTSNPIGTTMWITGIQIEQKSYPTTVVNGTRGDTVATGGGWADMSGNGNHGQLVNGVRESSDNLGALVFDGTNDYVTTTLGTYTPYCIDIWFKNDDNITSAQMQGNYQQLLGIGTYPGGISLGSWTSGAADETFSFFSAGWTGNGLTYIRDTASSGIHNLVVNWNGSSFDFWLDGTKRTAYASSYGHRILETVTGFQVGSAYNNANSYEFNGNVYSVKVYTSQLSDSQVQQNFNATRGRYGI